MADHHQYLHDVLAALVQCAHHGGTTHTDKGFAGASVITGPPDRSAEGDDCSAAASAAAAAAAAAAITAAAAAAEAAAAGARAHSRSRPHPPPPHPAPHEAPTGPGNTLAASTDILMAFVVLHLFQVGFRPDVGTATVSLEPSVLKLPLSTNASSKSLRGSRHTQTVHHKVHEREVLSRQSSKETAHDTSHDNSKTDVAAARADLKFRRQRRSAADAKIAKVKSLRQPRGMQTYTRHLQLEQQRLRRLKALRLQQTHNKMFQSSLPHPVKHEVPRKHIGGSQLMRGKWSTIAKHQSLVDPVKGTPMDKNGDKKKQPTEAEIILNDLRTFLTSPTFARCAKMVSVGGWNASAERGSYSMFMRLPPLSKYRFSLIGLPVAWHDVLVVNLALLPERTSRLERPSVTKYTHCHGPVGHTTVYTVAMALSEFIDNTPDGPRLKLGSAPKLVHLLQNSLSRPAACAAQTASGILNPSLLGLPAKAVSHILHHLSARDIAQVAKTCRALRTLSLQQSLWKHLVERDFGSARDPQSDYIDWRKDYIRSYRAENVLKARTLSAMCPGVSNIPSSELLRRSLSASRKSCGVNVESVELLKEARKSIGPGTVKFAPIHTAARENRIPTPVKPSFRPITRERSQALTKIDSKSFGMVPSPDEVLNSLCSFANTNLLENCNLNAFNFDEVFDKDLSGWKSDSKDQLRDKRISRARAAHRGNLKDSQTAPSAPEREKHTPPAFASVHPKLHTRHHKDFRHPDRQPESQTSSSAARRQARSTVPTKTRTLAFCQLINKPG